MFCLQKFAGAAHPLPGTSLVPFEAKKLAQAKVAWRNPSHSSGTIDFAGYAFAVPHSGDGDNDFIEQTKEFWADRYGGRGVNGNGGSARCGMDDKVQIKGIGPTPLAGLHRDFWHRHGGMTLGEAIREAIWGEIYHRVLPFGAVRTIGIIATNTKTYFPKNDGKTAHRALMLRELNVRPAHFMRAVYFSASDRALSRPGSDAYRTQQAIRSLQAILPFGKDGSDMSPEDPRFLNVCLDEMTSRIARQISTARALRLPHGAINCSNICVDGRYIDFGTCTSVPDFRNYCVAPGNPDFWNDEAQIYSTLNNLHFYLGKYLQIAQQAVLLPLQDLLDCFSSNMEEALIVQFARLSGIPEAGLGRLPRELVERFCFSVFSIAFSGTSVALPIWDQGKLTAASDGRGAELISLLLRRTAFSASVSDILKIAETMDDCKEHMIRQFAESLVELRRVYVREERHKAVPVFIRLHVGLNALRLNSSMPELLRPRLAEEVSELLRDGMPVDSSLISAFIGSRSSRAISLRAECISTTLPADFMKQIGYAGKPLSVAADGGKAAVRALCASLSTLRLDEPTLQSINSLVAEMSE